MTLHYFGVDTFESQVYKNDHYYQKETRNIIQIKVKGISKKKLF